ncbi:MAG: hypothetical protein NTY15_15585 [Planctomycetota bacterium]|nr:hypothetical protein [Planctomycetota bacterium]
MPIRVACQCGQSLNVPDTMAGKTGKCPKCQQVIRIPAAGGAASPQSGAPIGKSAKAGTTAAPAQANAMANLLDAAGIVQKTGTFCPSCDQASKPGAVLCTHCGYNFAEGTKVEGHKSLEKKQFGNKNLNHAVEMMARDESTQKRMLETGLPWWTIAASLIGLLIFLGGALIKKDEGQTGKRSTIPILAKIQAADWLPVMAASAGVGLMFVAIFAQFAVLFTAFFESAKQGLLCMFVPFYIIFYMFSRIRSHKLFTTVVILWLTSILAGVMLGYSLPKI